MAFLIEKLQNPKCIILFLSTNIQLWFLADQALPFTGYQQDFKNQIPFIVPVLFKKYPRVMCAKIECRMNFFSSNAAFIYPKC